MRNISLGWMEEQMKAEQVSKVEEENKALVRRIHAEVSKGNLGIFIEVLSPNYVRHCQAMPPGFQELHGTGQFKSFLADSLTDVPDCNDSVLFVIAEGDMVAYVTKMTGIQTGPMGDLPPSGKEFTLTNIVIHRIENGKVAETWVS
jgi:predicted ester cyclase